jgi:aryl-alcohol dehydrogenase-like predicted oxidoreductase
METRRFGRTGHCSTVAIFGAFSISQGTQEQADEIMKLVIQAGVNHIDIAPSYGIAEQHLGPWMGNHRDQFFLGCKTMERDQEGALAEMRRSLERLRTDHFDLYQIHAIETYAELDKATRRGGALEGMIAAREAGQTRFIGITGHGIDSPAIFLEALRRFDFDSVLFPINFVQYANPYFRENADELLRQCRARDVGTMIIKSITRSPWGDRPHTHITWYEPFTSPEDIQNAVNFALSQDITGICTSGDPQVLPAVLQACENYSPLSAEEQEAMVRTAERYQPLFV